MTGLGFLISDVGLSISDVSDTTFVLALGGWRGEN